LALAVAIGGLGQVTPSCAEKMPAAHADTHDSHAGHHHHSDDRHAAKPPVSTPACLKCCGICIADTGLTPAPAIAVVLNGSPVVFFTAFKTYKDRPFFIDPGIPKLVA